MKLLLVKGAHLSEFWRNSHTLQISFIADGLEISATNQQVHFDVVFPLELVNLSIDHIQFAVGASFDGNQHNESS